MQFPDPPKNYVLYTDASNNAYSGVLCQPISNDKDIRPVTYFSGTFTAQNKSWCATEKEAYAFLKSIQRFDYYLRGAKCTLRCNPQAVGTIPNQRHEDSKIGHMGDAASRVRYHICPHNRER